MKVVLPGLRQIDISCVNSVDRILFVWKDYLQIIIVLRIFHKILEEKKHKENKFDHEFMEYILFEELK